ncbi:MAG: DUF2459 domain-containing protein [Chloroflexota bacterium]
MAPSHVSLRPILAMLILCAVETCSTAQTAATWSCVPTQTQCRSLIIVRNFWHAAIVLRKADLVGAALPELADFPTAHFIEFSWGDKDYFPDPDAGVLTALKAAFWSGGSVLHLVGFSENIESFYRGAEIAELSLSAPAYARLIEYLSRSFARSRDSGRAPASPGLFSYSRFYPSTEKFSLMKTCNAWIASALEFAGLPVSPGMILTAAQLGVQIDKIKQHR